MGYRNSICGKSFKLDKKARFFDFVIIFIIIPLDKRGDCFLMEVSIFLSFCLNFVFIVGKVCN